MSFVSPSSLITAWTVWALLISSVGCIVESPPQDQSAVVPILTKLIEDPSPDVRRTAALSLGKIAHSNGVSPLLTALRDDDPQVREYSAWALGQMGPDLPEEAVIALITALGDESPTVKQASASALGQVEADANRVQVLKQILAISEVRTRQAVIQALTDFDTPEAYVLFVQALDDPAPRIRQAAVAGLGELADRRALPLLRKHLLKDGDEGVRTEAAYRLGKLGDKADVSSLKKAVKADPSSTVALWAQWALEQIKPPPLN